MSVQVSHIDTDNLEKVMRFSLESPIFAKLMSNALHKSSVVIFPQRVNKITILNPLVYNSLIPTRGLISLFNRRKWNQMMIQYVKSKATTQYLLSLFNWCKYDNCPRSDASAKGQYSLYIHNHINRVSQIMHFK